jgi:hypothetical protein
MYVCIYIYIIIIIINSIINIITIIIIIYYIYNYKVYVINIIYIYIQYYYTVYTTSFAPAERKCTENMPKHPQPSFMHGPNMWVDQCQQDSENVALVAARYFSMQWERASLPDSWLSSFEGVNCEPKAVGAAVFAMEQLGLP